jgi:small subunit ribosomal protein S16
MSVKIRLQRHGAKKRPYYFIVVANVTSRRDGKFIEKLGTYNPLTVPATIQVNQERALHWIAQGAQPTHTVNRILSFKGVLYMKHLMRGVKLGLFSETTAHEKFEAWNGSHEKLVADRQETHKKHKASSKIQPTIKKVEVVAPVAPAPVVVEETPVVEAVAEAPVVEAVTETPVVEAVAEAPVVEAVAETPVVEAVAETPVADAQEVKDDLVIIEGIGPKIAELCNAKGIYTFAQLAATSEETLQAMLNEAGSAYKVHNPGTWAQQAQLAADGKMDELKTWQDELKAGKEA